MILKNNEELVTNFKVGDIICFLHTYEANNPIWFTATDWFVRRYSNKNRKYIRKKDGQIGYLI